MINTIQLALQGLTGAAKKAEDAATGILRATTPASGAAGDGEKSFDLSLSEEAVRLSAAKIEYKANIGVLKTAMEMEDELLKSFDEKV